MAADLALAAGPGQVERSADPAQFVVQACQRAKAWLTEALEHGEIEQIAELKSQAEAVRVYTAQKQLGKDAQLAAAEIVRRAERGIGLAVRRGQHDGQIARRGDRGGCGAPGVRGGDPGATRGERTATRWLTGCQTRTSRMPSGRRRVTATCPGPTWCAKSAGSKAFRPNRPGKSSRTRRTGRRRLRRAAGS
jgi:hypothetical protein